MNYSEVLNIVSGGVTRANKETLINIMLNGPEPVHRKLVWMESTGAAQQLMQNEGYYAQLLTLKDKINPRVIEQISKDLLRTFPEEPFFKNTERITMLSRILIAYSIRNSTVGYCQGMGFIAGRLLSLRYTEEESFWILTQIMECYLPTNYFTNLRGLIVDGQVFSYLLQKNLPDLGNHFREIGLDERMFANKWLLCIFAYNFKENIVMRIWDIFFVKGTVFLFQVGIAILYIMRKLLLARRDATEANMILSRVSLYIQNENEILRCISQRKIQVSAAEVKELREYFAEPDQDIKEMTCKDTNGCKRIKDRTASFFTFSSGSEFNVIDNYLDEPLQAPDTQSLPIVGIPNHYCTTKIV